MGRAGAAPLREPGPPEGGSAPGEWGPPAGPCPGAARVSPGSRTGRSAVCDGAGGVTEGLPGGLLLLWVWLALCAV